MKVSMSLMTLLCITLCLAVENDIPPLGMWAWKQSHFITADSRKQMLDFCEREGISHIDQHVSIKGGAIHNKEALKQLVSEAAKRKITINALRGERSMFFAANHSETINDIKATVEFNRSLPVNARLAGIKFDVEPYLSTEWKAGGKEREKVILDYLAFLHKAKVYLNKNAPRLELAVDIPFWWDKPLYEIEFDGKRKLFVQHIQDTVDWIGIMSYRREARTTIRFVQTEVDYAEASGFQRSVAPAMETSNISGKEAHISFAGLPPDQFRAVLSELRKALAGNRQVRCIMLHHYGSLVSYLSGTLNKELKATDESAP